MVLDNPRAFATFVEREAGESLRLIVYYKRDEYNVVYARQDLQQAYGSEDIDEVTAAVRDAAAPEIPAETTQRTGSLQCQVLCFEDVVSVVLPVSAEKGVYISLDKAAASQLHDFATACRGYLTEVE